MSLPDKTRIFNFYGETMRLFMNVLGEDVILNSFLLFFEFFRCVLDKELFFDVFFVLFYFELCFIFIIN
jgi:hypothetical protein